MLQEIAVAHRHTLPIVVSLSEAAGAASDFASASKSAATRRAYQTDAADFAAWCGRHGLEPLPASVDTVAAYLASLATSGLRASTITRRCAGIRYMHRMAGIEPPTSNEAIKAVLAGIKRSIGTSVTRKSPATAEAIRAIIAEMPADLRGLRDRALLLLGFAGALRRSELVALDIADLEETPEGLHVRIRRSKTDQEGAGDFGLNPPRFAASPCCRNSRRGYRRLELWKVQSSVQSRKAAQRLLNNSQIALWPRSSRSEQRPLASIPLSSPVTACAPVSSRQPCITGPTFSASWT